MLAIKYNSGVLFTFCHIMLSFQLIYYYNRNVKRMVKRK